MDIDEFGGCSGTAREGTDREAAVELGADPSCPFCAPAVLPRIAAEHGSVFAIEDRDPITPGHTLIIPRRHTPDYFSMTSRELRDTEALLKTLKGQILRSDPTVGGFNVGTNSGAVAGQTVFHAHIHLVPRRVGDAPRPEFARSLAWGE